MAYSPPKDKKEPMWKLGFKNGIFEFMDGGTALCLVTCCCPCLTAGGVAQKVGKPCAVWGCLSILPGCGPYFRALVRYDVRTNKGINPGTFCEDVVIHYQAGCCALIQEARETDAEVMFATQKQG